MSARRCLRRSARTLTLLLALAPPALATAQEAGVQDSGHVAPPPPAQPMAPMSAAQMDEVMDMHDDPLLAMLRADQLERACSDGDCATSWDVEAWVGHDFDKLWLRSEGDRAAGGNDARIEAFWDHAFAGYWDWQLGVRRDFGNAPERPYSSRDWAGFGIQGLAPYWFEVEAAAYVGASGRCALRLRAQYDLLLTQRWILQPQIEMNAYSRRDAARDVAAGLADAELGVRLRYEIRREVAPYVGIVWQHRSVLIESQPRHSGSDTQLVAGLRVWF